MLWLPFLFGALAGALVGQCVAKNSPAADLDFGDRPGALYVSCYDGDTCTFTLPGIDPLIGWQIPVRLRGVDAPEIRGSCQEENEQALQARAVARATLEKAKTIILRRVERGKYFRIVAEVEIDGQDLGTLLVESGLALRWNGEGPKPNWCPATGPDGSPQPPSGVSGATNGEDTGNP